MQSVIITHNSKHQKTTMKNDVVQMCDNPGTGYRPPNYRITHSLVKDKQISLNENYRAGKN